MSVPVTTLYAALLGVLLVWLSNRVSSQRKRTGISLGRSGDPILERAVRAHGNFIEYVPFALLLLLLLEVQGPPRWQLHALGGALLIGRLLHAWGMYYPDGAISGRFWGTALTWLMVLAASLLNFWHLV
jgi:uncharacterized membrane protein YecN with MAPEG domain